MNRSALCALANFEVARFKSLAHREELPFPTVKAASKVTGRKWGNYTAHAALLLTLFDRASENRSVERTALLIAEASALIRRRGADLNSPAPEKDLWLCIIGYNLSDGKSTWASGRPFVGTMIEIAKQFGDFQFDYESEIINVSLLNVSDAYRRILARADPDDRDDLASELGSAPALIMAD